MSELNFTKNKLYYVGLSMASSATLETGVAILDNQLNLVRIDKLYSIDEIKLFFESLSGKDGIIIGVSLPDNNIMLSGKWRIAAKPYRLLSENSEFKEKSWTKQFSDRGSDYCADLQSRGYELFRYNVSLTKNILKLNSPYKERSPVECKHFQMAIKEKLSINGITSNMIPAAALEAILGAYTGFCISKGQENVDYKKVSEFNDLPVVTALNSVYSQE